jgi:hypothetical protein
MNLPIGYVPFIVNYFLKLALFLAKCPLNMLYNLIAAYSVLILATIVKSSSLFKNTPADLLI